MLQMKVSLEVVIFVDIVLLGGSPGSLLVHKKQDFFSLWMHCTELQTH